MACIPCAEVIESAARTLRKVINYAPKYLPKPGDTWEEISNQLIMLGGKLRQTKELLPKEQ